MISGSKEVILSVEGLNKSYGNNKILKNIHLDVYEGELLILLGPSGCGKTTLLRIINGQIEAESGHIILKDQDITNVHCNKRDMGFVFQNYALFPHMNVVDNIAFGLRMRKVHPNEIDKKVNAMLETMHLSGLGKRKIDELSGGQQQRVALARALVLHPSLLLMDEPLSNLDAKLRASVRVEIAQIQKALGVTTILVTHDQIEAMTMGDRIALMQDGVIQQISKPIDIYEYPANIFVASFVGSPSINLFQVQITEDSILIPEFGVKLPIGSFRKYLKHSDRISEILIGEYILGVRPEDILIYNQVDKERVITKGKVTYIEPLGSETLIHLRVANKSIVSRLPRVVTDISNEGEVLIGFRSSSSHLFDKKTGKRKNFEL